MHRIGIQTAHWYRPDDPDGSFAYIKARGFTAIDYSLQLHLSGSQIKKGELTDFYDRSVEEILEGYRPVKEAMQKHDVVIYQMHAPFPLWVKPKEDDPDFDAEKINAYVAMAMEKMCAIADYLDCRAIVCHPITRSTKEKEWETNMNMYRSFMPGAKKYKVKICLENLFGNYKGRIIEGACTEVSEACAYIDALNAEAGEDVFGLCLDIGHATLMRRNLYQYIKALGPRLTCLHIHDNDGQDDLHMMPFTYTHTWGKNLVSDWDGFINGLRDINYQGDLCFETFRVLESFPRDLWDYAFRLISATGRYFVKRIESET